MTWIAGGMCPYRYREIQRELESPKERSPKICPSPFEFPRARSLMICRSSFEFPTERFLRILP